MLTLNLIKQELQKKIVGQEDVCTALSVTMFKYLFKILAWKNGFLDNCTATNLLIIGKTGTGKTYLTKLISDQLGLPFIEINAKSISQEGWSGTSLVQHISKEIEKYNITEGKDFYPIIFLDEIDKICMPLASDKSDNYNLQLQSSILKYIEGCKITVKNKEYDTNKFCWVFAGAFMDLFKKTKDNIGFTLITKNDKIDFYQELINFGMIEELASRIMKITKTNDFTEADYHRFINHPEGVIMKWNKFLKELSLPLILSEKQDEIVTKALEKDLGMRGLIQLLEEQVNKQLIESLNDLDLNLYFNQMKG